MCHVMAMVFVIYVYLVYLSGILISHCISKCSTLYFEDFVLCLFLYLINHNVVLL